MEKHENISLLLDTYGELISERHREIARLYYDEDLSLNEIGQLIQISKQAVHDALKKTEKELKLFEEKLKLLEKEEQIRAEINVVRSSMEMSIRDMEVKHGNKTEKFSVDCSAILEWIEKLHNIEDSIY